MVRYGITGFGLHAVKRLMPGFTRSKLSRCVALQRRNLEQGRKDAAQFGIDHVFGSVEELCACPDVDAVFVSSPNSIHLGDVVAAAKHRKPVLCEKPMAMTAAEVEQMIRACDEAGVPLGVAQCMRFEQSVNLMRERVQRGDIGDIQSINIDFTFVGLESPRKWLNDAALAGGGPIADVGVHTLDTMRYILGDDPVRVKCETKSDERSGGVEATARFELYFSRGAVGRSYVSFREEYRTPVEIVGTKGSIGAKDALNVERPIAIEIEHNGRIEREMANNAETYALQVDAFSRAVTGEAEFPISGEEGLKNQRILDALYRSARTGREEQL